MHTLFSILVWIARLLLAAFFGFVGYFKALGPWEVLVEHRAWVTEFSPGFARAVGWSEILLGLSLLTAATPRLRPVALGSAALLVANQLAAALVHYSRQEFDALPQNGVIILLLSLIIGSTFTRKPL